MPARPSRYAAEVMETASAKAGRGRRADASRGPAGGHRNSGGFNPDLKSRNYFIPA
jgi:hypothetical protein